MPDLSEHIKDNNKQRPFDFTLSLIGGKWKMKIMYELASEKILRYGEIKRKIPAITHKMLSSQLNELESSEIIYRKEYPQVPPKVEYSLTPKGKSLMPILEEMCKWGVENQR